MTKSEKSRVLVAAMCDHLGMTLMEFLSLPVERAGELLADYTKSSSYGDLSADLELAA